MVCFIASGVRRIGTFVFHLLRENPAGNNTPTHFKKSGSVLRRRRGNSRGILYWFFAVNIYPAIPYEWGGGKPLDVIFLEGDKPLPDGIVKDGNTRHSIPYKLVVVTEKSYVVLPCSC